MMPVAVSSRRTRQPPSSPMYTSEPLTARPYGMFNVALAACPPSPVDVPMPVPATVRMLQNDAGLVDGDGDRVVVADVVRLADGVGVSVAVPVCEMRPDVQLPASHRTARTCDTRTRKAHETSQAGVAQRAAGTVCNDEPHVLLR
jgi:hypothetical protein